MAVKLFTKKVGDRTFAFGNLALRRFTEALGCAPTIQSVHAAFQGSTQIGAVIEMIKAGAEHGGEELITEHEAAKIADGLTDKQQADLLETFFSSIVGEPFEGYLKKLQKALDATEPREPSVMEEAGKPEASPIGGAKSKKGDTTAS